MQCFHYYPEGTAIIFRKYFKTPWFCFYFQILFPSLAFAITPMEYFNSLVAGAEASGFKNGPFYQVWFNHPASLFLVISELNIEKDL